MVKLRDWLQNKRCHKSWSPQLHQTFRLSRLTCHAIDTTKGQLTVDLIVKVVGEDKLLTSIFGPHTGVRTDSTEMRPKPCR